MGKNRYCNYNLIYTVKFSYTQFNTFNCFIFSKCFVLFVARVPLFFMTMAAMRMSASSVDLPLCS